MTVDGLSANAVKRLPPENGRTADFSIFFLRTAYLKNDITDHLGSYTERFHSSARMILDEENLHAFPKVNKQKLGPPGTTSMLDAFSRCARACNVKLTYMCAHRLLITC